MRVWLNKRNGNLFVAAPWWETVDSDFQFNGKTKTYNGKIGVLYQVGWLIQNEHGIWFGANYNITGRGKDFEDLGPL